jgi:hypothetical protein
MRTLIIVAAMVALLPATAYSQKGQQQGPSPFARTDEQKRRDAEVDKAYKEVLKSDKAHTAPAKIDPWQSIRPADANTGKP